MARKERAREVTGGRITLLLVVINILVFLLVFSAPESVREGIFSSYSLSQGTALQPWRWMTSMFLHAGASHLFFNMLGLYFFGRMVERELKPQWFLAVYFFSGLLGSLAFLLTSAAPVVGASGAIFGLLGAAMLLRPLGWVNFFVFPLPLGIVAAMFVIVESFVLYYQSDFGNVAHIAHIGGLLTGAFSAFMHSPKRAGKGLLLLAAMAAMLIVLAPLIGIVTGLGQFILDGLDYVIGIALYGLAGLLSFLWA